MKKNIYVRLDERMGSDDAKKIVDQLIDPPLGKYAISRTASLAAIGMLDKCVKNSSLKKKFDPEIRFEVPCPNWFNAFYKSGVGTCIAMDELLPGNRSLNLTSRTK